MNNTAKKIYKVAMLIIVVALVTFIITSVFMYNKFGKNKYAISQNLNSKLASKIYTLKNIINKKYIYNVDEDNLIDGAIKGYAEGLGDEYTEYFTKEEMEEFKTETEGNYVGVGIYMTKNIKDNTIVVISSIKNSPAEAAGIQPGDIIKKVDDTKYTGDDFETISSYIKGKEGTKVKIGIERDDEELSFEIERKNIDLYPIESEVLENNIGYINITSFDENSAKEFKEIYEGLNKKNIKNLIIDLRNNGGGLLEEATQISDYILEKDKIILITKDKNNKEEIQTSKNNPIINIPIVILANENTASASEVLIGALKDNNKVTVIGEKTYGKGVIQELITLSDGSGIKITTEEYYTPNRTKINKKGIMPDKKVELPSEIENIYNVERKDDTQLAAAIKEFKK